MFYLRKNFSSRIVYQVDIFKPAQLKQMLLLSLPVWHQQKTDGVDCPNEWAVVHEAIQEYLGFSPARSFLHYRHFIEGIADGSNKYSKDSIKNLIIHSLAMYRKSHSYEDWLNSQYGARMSAAELAQFVTSARRDSSVSN